MVNKDSHYERFIRQSEKADHITVQCQQNGNIINESQSPECVDLKQALKRIWDSFPEETICKYVLNFRRRLKQMVDTLNISWSKTNISFGPMNICWLIFWLVIPS